MVLLFWCHLTQVIREKRLLNEWCSVVVVVVVVVIYIFMEWRSVTVWSRGQSRNWKTSYQDLNVGYHFTYGSRNTFNFTPVPSMEDQKSVSEGLEGPVTVINISLHGGWNDAGCNLGIWEAVSPLVRRLLWMLQNKLEAIQRWLTICCMWPWTLAYQKFLLSFFSQGQYLYSHQKVNMYIYWFSSESGYRRRWRLCRQRRTPQYNH